MWRLKAEIYRDRRKTIISCYTIHIQYNQFFFFKITDLFLHYYDIWCRNTGRISLLSTDFNVAIFRNE